MGIGDEIMAAGDARLLHEHTGERVEIVGRDGVRRWHPVWEGLRYIMHPHDRGSCVRMVNGPGRRPYHVAKEPDRWRFDLRYRAARAEIVFTDAEREFARQHERCIVIEPHLKSKAPPGKQWGWVRWNKLAYILQCHGFGVTQMGSRGTPLLDGANLIETPTFRHAAAVLSVARGAILPEGGLHHAAAAVGCPAVVIFGGFTPIEVTGYDGHVNIGASGEEACGMRVPCKHCDKWMARINPHDVAAHFLRIKRQ